MVEYVKHRTGSYYLHANVQKQRWKSSANIYYLNTVHFVNINNLPKVFQSETFCLSSDVSLHIL